MPYDPNNPMVGQVRPEAYAEFRRRGWCDKNGNITQKRYSDVQVPNRKGCGLSAVLLAAVSLLVTLAALIGALPA